jgi:hypothetical protein
MMAENWLTELHAVLAADPEPMPTLIKHARQRTHRVKKAKKIVDDDSGSSASRELVNTSVAAKYLGCAPGTLSNWITYKKFTRADGLRKMGASREFICRRSERGSWTEP